jgi:hypothetical protein
MKPRRATSADAKALVTMYARNFGTSPFRIERKPHLVAAIDLAERLGWIWVTEDRASVTIDGVRAVADYVGERT